MPSGAPQFVAPNGAAAATLIAAGVGCATLAAAVMLAAASDTVAAALTISEPVGPLSGKTTLAALAWLLSWPVLHRLLRLRTVSVRTAVRATLALLAVGLIGTFPPVYELLAR